MEEDHLREHHARTRSNNLDPTVRGSDYSRGKNQTYIPDEERHLHERYERNKRRLDRQSNIVSKERSLGEILWGEIRELYRILLGKD